MEYGKVWRFPKLNEEMWIQSSMFPQRLGITSKATIETSNSVVILAIADLGSATGAASTQPNH